LFYTDDQFDWHLPAICGLLLLLLLLPAALLS
jgi:hypothetical protein